MVTVKDTASFIHASRHQHGNRYDYSLSEWSGANGRIVITCRVCGPFKITADSHYRKGCGCRQCALKSKARREGSFHVCPLCRQWAKYRGASRYCKACQRTRRPIKNWISRLTVECNHKHTEFLRKSQFTGWFNFCDGAARRHFYRKASVTAVTKEIPNNWESTCKALAKRITARARDHKYCEWTKKCRSFTRSRGKAMSGKVKPSDIMELLKKQEFKCALSGAKLTPKNSSVDHKVPVSKGGKHERSNLQVVLRKINNMKGTLTNEEFISLCSTIVNHQAPPVP